MSDLPPGPNRIPTGLTVTMLWCSPLRWTFAASARILAAIPHNDRSQTMTQAFNDSVSARIRANPEQWYWLLRRWQGA